MRRFKKLGIQMKKRITAIRVRVKLKQRKMRLAQMNRVAKMMVWAPKPERILMTWMTMPNMISCSTELFILYCHFALIKYQGFSILYNYAT